MIHQWNELLYKNAKFNINGCELHVFTNKNCMVKRPITMSMSLIRGKRLSQGMEVILLPGVE